MSLMDQEWMSKLEQFARKLALRDVYLIADQGVLDNPLLDGLNRLSPPVRSLYRIHTTANPGTGAKRLEQQPTAAG